MFPAMRSTRPSTGTDPDSKVTSIESSGADAAKRKPIALAWRRLHAWLRSAPSDQSDLGDGPRPRLRDYLTLRPYGRSMLTPAVAVWLGFAWTLIFLMAGIEAVVWGIVGASIVPHATPWLKPVAAAFMFVLMLAVVWIVDASLIMSERPALIRRPGELGRQGGSALLRWTVGLLARVAIVAVSLYVTAPFLAKVIRADDIERWHRANVEQYFVAREATLQAQIQQRAEQLRAEYQTRAEVLEMRIARLTESLSLEKNRRGAIEAEFAPEIEVLRQEAAAARKRFGDEVQGRNDRPEGYGPEARKWEARANELDALLEAKQQEMNQRLDSVQAAIVDQEARLARLSDELAALRAEQQARLDAAAEAIEAEQPPPSPPRLTFAARSKGLAALRESPDEAGVPHFETVDGFAQAALAILFFSLIALKLFEPPAVRNYFSEALQLQYRKYRAGGLAHIPGFDGQDDPDRRLSPPEMARLWERFDTDPSGFYREQQARAAAMARKRVADTDLAAELALIEQQQRGAEARLAHLEHRHQRELTALDQELALRMEHLRGELADESDRRRERERLEREHQREEQRLRERQDEHRMQLQLAELQQRELADERAHQQAMAREQMLQRRAERRDRLAALGEALTALREQVHKTQEQYREAVIARHGVDDEVAALEQSITDLQAESAERVNRATALSEQIDASARAEAAEASGQVQRQGLLQQMRMSGSAGARRAAQREHRRLEEQIADDRRQLETLRQRLRNQRAESDALPLRIEALRAALNADQARIRDYQDLIGDLLSRDALEDEPGALTVKGVSSS